MAAPTTVWYAPDGAEPSTYTASNLADSTANTLVDASGVSLIDAGVLLTPVPATVWSQDDAR